MSASRQDADFKLTAERVFGAKRARLRTDFDETDTIRIDQVDGPPACFRRRSIADAVVAEVVRGLRSVDIVVVVLRRRLVDDFVRRNVLYMHAAPIITARFKYATQVCILSIEITTLGLLS